MIVDTNTVVVYRRDEPHQLECKTRESNFNERAYEFECTVEVYSNLGRFAINRDRLTTALINRPPIIRLHVYIKNDTSVL